MSDFRETKLPGGHVHLFIAVYSPLLNSMSSLFQDELARYRVAW